MITIDLWTVESCVGWNEQVSYMTFADAIAAYDPFQGEAPRIRHWHAGALRSGQSCGACDLGVAS